MRVRYEITDMNLKISNVTPPDSDTYVLITASDGRNNEIVVALSPEQAERLEDELYEANRRRRQHAAAASVNYTEEEPAQPQLAFEETDEQFTH